MSAPHLDPELLTSYIKHLRYRFRRSDYAHWEWLAVIRGRGIEKLYMRRRPGAHVHMFKNFEPMEYGCGYRASYWDDMLKMYANSGRVFKDSFSLLDSGIGIAPEKVELLALVEFLKNRVSPTAGK